ncbi:aminomethyl-transferring glycine dehydrogenase subunit GcvPA [Sandarakinorhabdus sp. DWP1-3-1]|uniref:aminomethyl-transferring glycine dehydrogenase subunit GcvPA n=1 Tax=Sandarakinorhabdus sp. DWP1-3-1 TaxID=2804627 RepID=UPI003CE7F121
MPNSAPALRAALLAELGLDSVEPLFGQIPQAHRFTGDLAQPPALAEEIVLARHLRTTLARNVTGNLGFLGGGIWQHHVPAVVDEIVNRAEFLTPVWGTPSSDFGRNQAWFEFTSQLGALLDLELVGLPVYSWGCAAGHAFRMAARLTGRRRILVPARLCPERRAVITAYCASADPAAAIALVDVPCDPLGRLDLAALAGLLDAEIAAVYYENPAYLGGLEAGAADIARLARAAGAETIAGINPISLGVIAPPGALGVDIAVGTIQPLGIHMAAGGGLGGFIASRDEARYAVQYPTLLNSLATTIAGEMAFGLMLFHQSSYGSRDEGNDWAGNSTYLWAIAATTYMALLGPTGFRELGELLLVRTRDAAAALAAVPGVTVVAGDGRFVDLVVDFNATGRRVADINAALLDHGIFGGLDLSRAFPDLGQCALYAVTEIHDDDDIARLAAALSEVLA